MATDIIKIPGSKSISNRAILLASLANGCSHITNALHSEDTRWMLDICKKLGAEIHEHENGDIYIQGVGGKFKACAETLYVGNAGTCARFLCAALLCGKGTYTLDGNTRMRERPMSELINVLRLLGANIVCLNKEGFLPLSIEADSKPKGGKVYIRGDVSSQYLSALLMLAPLTQDGIEIESSKSFVSSSYIDMTCSMMEIFGAHVEKDIESHTYTVLGLQKYTATNFKIPADASSASYFFALAALTGEKITVKGLHEYPIQGDLQFANLLKVMGACVLFENDSVSVWRPKNKPLTGISVDMKDISDVVPTLAVVAMFAEGPTEIRNVAHMRGKECDRIHALCTELRKCGANITEYEDGLKIIPPQKLETNVHIQTYDDHRIAMAFAILGQCVPDISLENPLCVRKTFPDFFSELNRLLFGEKLKNDFFISDTNNFYKIS